MGENLYTTAIFAPLTGQVVGLDQVPDPVYAKKMMGDGVAIIPTDGGLYSPVTGYVTVVAEDKHAFGFTTDEGLELLVHIGVESKFQEDCCATFVKINDRVQAGDLIAQFQLDKLQERGVNPITPVIICGGMEGKEIHPNSGEIQAGAGAIMTVIDLAARERAEQGNKPQTVQEPVKPEPKPQKPAEDNDAMAFLQDRRNWPKLIGGLVGLTAILVVIIVSLVMFIGR